MGYLISGRLLLATEGAEQSQTATQCFAAGNSFDNYTLHTDDSKWCHSPHEKDLEIHNKVADFLRIESLRIEDPSTTSHGDDFLQHFQSQITYCDGTYLALLPWLDNHPPLPSNLNLAFTHLQQVRQRLLKMDLWGP